MASQKVKSWMSLINESYGNVVYHVVTVLPPGVRCKDIRLYGITWGKHVNAPINVVAIAQELWQVWNDATVLGGDI